MLPLDRRRKLILAGIGVVLQLTITCCWWWMAHHPSNPIRRSAEDLLVLQLAIDRGGAPLYPEAVFKTPELRSHYGILPGVSQAQVNELLHVDSTGNIYNCYKLGVDLDLFRYRHKDWQFVYNYNQALLPHADMEIRLQKTMSQVTSMMHEEQQKLRMDLSSYASYLNKRAAMPTDPFAAPGSDKLYRYWLSPKKCYTQGKMWFHPEAAWIIAGNGPDGDADVDVTRFNAEPTTSTGKIDPWLGFGQPPLNILYDPTNGTVSNGDIYLIHPISGQPLPIPKTLGDEDDFKKRYGL